MGQRPSSLSHANGGVTCPARTTGGHTSPSPPDDRDAIVRRSRQSPPGSGTTYDSTRRMSLPANVKTVQNPDRSAAPPLSAPPQIPSATTVSPSSTSRSTSSVGQPSNCSFSTSPSNAAFPGGACFRRCPGRRPRSGRRGSPHGRRGGIPRRTFRPPLCVTTSGVLLHRPCPRPRYTDPVSSDFRPRSANRTLGRHRRCPRLVAVANSIRTFVPPARQ